jgi:hypothetical protein
MSVILSLKWQKSFSDIFFNNFKTQPSQPPPKVSKIPHENISPTPRGHAFLFSFVPVLVNPRNSPLPVVGNETAPCTADRYVFKCQKIFKIGSSNLKRSFAKSWPLFANMGEKKRLL